MKFNESGTPKKSPLSLQIDLEKFKPATEERKATAGCHEPSSSFFRDGLKNSIKIPLP
jgi:oligopeptide transport system permease protein